MKKADLEFVIFDTEDVIATSGGGCPQAHYFPEAENGFYYVDLNNNRQYDQGVDKYIGENASKYYYHANGDPCRESPLPYV